ncbi:MAG: hypothetical protein ACRCX8_06540 [Sarcina sp.]
MSNRELLKQFEAVVVGLEKNLKNKVVTDGELREEIIHALKFSKGIYVPNITIGEIEENADYLRVIIENEVYPDLMVGYENVKENDECILTCNVEYVDMEFEGEE